MHLDEKLPQTGEDRLNLDPGKMPLNVLQHFLCIVAKSSACISNPCRCRREEGGAAASNINEPGGGPIKTRCIEIVEHSVTESRGVKNIARFRRLSSRTRCERPNSTRSQYR